MITTQRITLTPEPVKIVSAGSDSDTVGLTATIKFIDGGSGAVIGGEDVTDATGYPIESGVGVSIFLDGEDLWAKATDGDGNTQAIAVLLSGA